MLELQSVTKAYGNRKALDSISLSLMSGQTHILIGSSGSGKSSLLRAVLGLVSIDQGAIQIDGKSVVGMTSRERAEKIGYVPQDAGLFPHLTAYENATLVAKSIGWSQQRIESRFKDLNQIVLLNENLFQSFPGELSGGQKQRVALLRSLFLDPQLILMDEPFGALDPLVRAEIQSEVKSLFSRLRKTVVFVTHDIGEAHYLADHMILLHEGRVIQKGTLEDFMERPTDPFVTKFLHAQRILQVLRDKK